MPVTNAYRIYPCGDHAVTIELGDTINAAVNEKVIALFGYLKEKQLTGVRDIIPAYHTVTIVYDIGVLRKQQPNATSYHTMCTWLQDAMNAVKIAQASKTNLVRIPVCYDPSLAPDIESLSQQHNITVDGMINLHTGKNYRVYMIGFLPGFAYMGSVDEKIATPRRSQPRTLVPAGSVGIAGEQTGIYPLDSPGGWQLIGRTPVSLFAADKESPCYLQPGDEVQFYAISLTEYAKQKQR